jgi:hypothetical protein
MPSCTFVLHVTFRLINVTRIRLSSLNDGRGLPAQAHALLDGSVSPRAILPPSVKHCLIKSFTQIRPSTVPGSRPRFDPMQVTQQVRPESQVLSVAFTTLTGLVRDFFRQPSLSMLNPFSPDFYAQLSLSVDVFCGQCTLVFGNSEQTPSKGLTHPGNEFYEVAPALSEGWLEFKMRMKTLAKTGPELCRTELPA